MFSSCKVKNFYYLTKFFSLLFSKKIFLTVNEMLLYLYSISYHEYYIAFYALAPTYFTGF